MKRQTWKSCMALGVALGAATLGQGTPVAGAADAVAMDSKGAMMASQPMMVTGKVNNYWTDSSGYVTSMDIQTANGPAVVHFVPGMGNRLMGTYPIGSTSNVWVQGSMMEGTQHWDLVGVGDKMPAAGFWPVMDMSGLDLTTGWPLIDSGSERVTVEGKLRRVVVDKWGQVVGLVVQTDVISKGAVMNHLGMAGRGDTVWSASTGGAPNWTLLRVGQEYRPAPSHGNMRGVTPLVVGDDIMATGYMESTRYGAISNYGQRLISSAIAVNGQTVGLRGFPTMKQNEPVLLGFNLNLPLITGKAPDALQVVPGGYEVYSGSSGTMAPK